MNLSDQIADDLRRRIDTGQPLPARLTLHALAEHYGASTRPVRQALEVLAGGGYVALRPHGRLQVARPAAGGGAGDRPAPAAANWEAALAAEVIGASLRGPAGFLREEATAARYGVGRTLLREVLLRLEGQGLVTHLPRRGWQVRRLDRAELCAYLDVREALELTALDLARPRLERGPLEAMLRGNTPPAPGGGERLDNRLHQYLIDRAENPFLRDFFARHGRFYAALLEQAALEGAVVAEMAAQHRAILRALLERRWSAARRELAEHIRGQKPLVLALMTAGGGNRPGVWPERPRTDRRTA
jgi:DNA-binding GntR family transcriptional regulator